MKWGARITPKERNFSVKLVEREDSTYQSVLWNTKEMYMDLFKPSFVPSLYLSDEPLYYYCICTFCVQVVLLHLYILLHLYKYNKYKYKPKYNTTHNVCTHIFVTFILLVGLVIV